MFILDSLMIAGIQWALKTTITAAEAEMNDDTALREQLLEAEMRREMGEISDDDFEEIEADLLGRIREIKARRDGGGPLAMGPRETLEVPESGTFEVEASVTGDWDHGVAASDEAARLGDDRLETRAGAVARPIETVAVAAGHQPVRRAARGPASSRSLGATRALRPSSEASARTVRASRKK